MLILNILQSQICAYTDYSMVQTFAPLHVCYLWQLSHYIFEVSLLINDYWLHWRVHLQYTDYDPMHRALENGRYGHAPIQSGIRLQSPSSHPSNTLPYRIDNRPFSTVHALARDVTMRNRFKTGSNNS